MNVFMTQNPKNLQNNNQNMNVQVDFLNTVFN